MQGIHAYTQNIPLHHPTPPTAQGQRVREMLHGAYAEQETRPPPDSGSNWVLQAELRQQQDRVARARRVKSEAGKGCGLGGQGGGVGSSCRTGHMR